MNKKHFLTFLALLLIAAMLTGCGGAEAAQSASSAISAETVSPESETVTEVTEEPEVPVPEEVPSAVKAEPSVVEPEPIEVFYPLTEETVELTMWATEPNLGPLNMMGGDYGVNNYADFKSVQYVNELTNVNVVFDSANTDNASTLFNLHVASGDWADMLVDVDRYYVGGAMGAYNEGVIVSIDDYLQEYCPNYYALIEGNQDLTKAATSAEGEILQVNALFEKVYIAQGLVIRQDWLDRVDMDIPTQMDELHEILLAFQSEIGCANPVYMNSACNTLLTSYNLVSYQSLDGSDLALYQVDGEVFSTFTSEKYKEWLTTMSTWYAEGLIDPNFASVSDTFFGGHDEELIAQDNLGAWWGNVNAFTNYASMCPNEDFEVVPVYVTADGEGKDHVTSLSQVYGFSDGICGVAISDNCEEIELALGWLDYWYSEEGITLANYGTEGEVYEVIDGENIYTELVTENEFGLDPTVVLNLYAVAGCSWGVQSDARTFQFYTEQQVAALETWTDSCDGIYTYPNVPMNTEESEAISSNVGDCATYIAECIPKFINGEMSVETQWQEYVDTANALGMTACLEAYQSALDRYNAE